MTAEPDESPLPKFPSKAKRGRLRRHIEESIGSARRVAEEPRKIPTLLRNGLLGIWRTRGGGFYGLGYVICFVVLEVRMFVGDVETSDGVVSFVVMEVLGFIFRFTVQSFINGLLAFLWPFFVIEQFDVAGAIAIVVAWIVFQRLIKPRIDAWIPEMKSGDLR